jgi:hypothetical protein
MPTNPDLRLKRWEIEKIAKYFFESSASKNDWKIFGAYICSTDKDGNKANHILDCCSLNDADFQLAAKSTWFIRRVFEAYGVSEVVGEAKGKDKRLSVNKVSEREDRRKIARDRVARHSSDVKKAKKKKQTNAFIPSQS